MIENFEKSENITEQAKMPVEPIDKPSILKTLTSSRKLSFPRRRESSKEIKHLDPRLRGDDGSLSLVQSRMDICYAYNCRVAPKQKR